MKHPPLLSIIIPVHNVEPYLERAVRSLMAQTVADHMEVILVENGSTDSSPHICRQLAEEFPSVRVVVSKEVGPSQARNLGMELSRGEVVGFIDGDDYVDPSMFGELLEALEEYGADAAYCNYVLEYEDGSRRNPFEDTGKVAVKAVSDVVADTITERSTSAPWVRIIRREKLGGCRFPDGVFYEDHAVIYEWMSRMEKIVHVDKPFYHYCIRSGSTTTTTSRDLSKIRDYFNADLARIPFVRSYRAFSDEQRIETERHVTGVLLTHLKNYILAMSQDDPMDQTLADMRRRLLATLGGAGGMKAGMETRMKLFRLRYFWKNYYAHYRRRLK